MTKPFYESIIDVIQATPVNHVATIMMLGDLIRTTAIIKNHDAISAAWMTLAKKRERMEAQRQVPLENRCTLKQEWFEEIRRSILAQKSSAAST